MAFEKPERDYDSSGAWDSEWEVIKHDSEKWRPKTNLLLIKKHWSEIPLWGKRIHKSVLINSSSTAVQIWIISIGVHTGRAEIKHRQAFYRIWNMRDLKTTLSCTIFTASLWSRGCFQLQLSTFPSHPRMQRFQVPPFTWHKPRDLGCQPVPPLSFAH